MFRGGFAGRPEKRRKMPVYYCRCVIRGLITVGFLGLVACASVPKEAVILSHTVGEDIQQLHVGYRKSVQFSFEQMRQAGLAVIDERWTPIYLKDFIKNGGLVEFAQADNTEAVEYWARRAIRDIDTKRQEFLQPLKQSEDKLLTDIDEAFSRTIHANAAVTAHLTSVVKIRNMQDEVLAAVGVKDIRDKINNGIVQASNFAADAIKEIEDATAILEKAQ